MSRAPAGLEVLDHPVLERVEGLAALLDLARRHDAHAPLDEQKWLELASAGAGTAGVVARDAQGNAIGYAHVARRPSPAGPVWNVQAVVAPGHRRAETSLALVGRALDVVAERGGGRVQLWANRAGPDDDALAASLTLVPEREVVQLRRPLPVGEAPRLPPGIRLRSFRPGADDGAWLAVHHAAFADHPEQGAWTLSDLHRRMAEPWFDETGFVIAEDGGGAIAGSCWTKLHQPEGLGEIYVIGVDPSHQGRGLGRALVVAGLERLASRGAHTGMLYTDAANHRALALYASLGFTLDHADRVYAGEVQERDEPSQ